MGEATNKESSDDHPSRTQQEVEATLKPGEWGQVIDALRDQSDLFEHGDYIDGYTADQYERLADNLQEQTNG